MRLKVLIPALIVLSLAIGILFWHRPLQRPPVLVTPQESVQPTNTSGANAPVATQAVFIPLQTVMPQSNSEPFITNNAKALNTTKQFIESRNVPVDFYGQFLDQDGNPIPGVDIKCSILHMTMPDPLAPELGSKEIYLQRSSDAAGRFEMHGETGQSIYVESIQKDGYELSPNFSHNYGPSSGSFDNPVIIKMWRKGTSDQLVSQGGDTHIPYDGTPVVFDLLTGQKNAGDSTVGDLRVTLIRNPLNIPSNYRNAFEWHATIEAIDGGLVQSDDEFMYVAPEEGYQPLIKIDMPSNSAHWKNIYDISFYAKTRGGKVYSRVKFEFRVDYTDSQTGFTFSSTANPNGSRNLQP